MRIVFVNLHGNEFLLKTSSKMLFKQSVAIKHKYFLDYLLEQPDVEVCSYINKKGFSLAYTLGKPFAFLRFLEHKIVLKKNGIDLSKIKVLKLCISIMQINLLGQIVQMCLLLLV